MIRLCLVFLTTFVTDNLLVLFFPLQPIYSTFYVIPNVLLSSLVLYTFFNRHKYIYIIAAILGILYDICYADLFGLHLFIFVGTVFLIQRLVLNLIPVNVLSMLGLMSISIVFKEWIVFFIVSTLRGSTLSFSEYNVNFILPTVLVNIVFIIISYPILKSQYLLVKH